MHSGRLVIIIVCSLLVSGHSQEVPVGVPEGGQGFQAGGTEFPVADHCQHHLHDSEAGRGSADVEPLQQVPHR